MPRHKAACYRQCPFFSSLVNPWKWAGRKSRKSLCSNLKYLLLATVIPKLVLSWDKPALTQGGWSGMVAPLLSYGPDYSPACLPQLSFPSLLNLGRITFVFLDDSSWAEQPLCPSHCISLDISQAFSPKPVMLTAPVITAPCLPSHKQRISNLLEAIVILEQLKKQKNILWQNIIVHYSLAFWAI